MRRIVALVIALLLFSYCAVAQQYVVQQDVATSQYAWFVYYNEFELNTLNHGYVYVPLISTPSWCVQENGALHCYANAMWHVFYVFNFDLRPMFESSPNNALNFTAYVKVPCSGCEAGIALLNSAKDFAFNVVVSSEGFVFVRILNFVRTNQEYDVYYYFTDVGYIGYALDRWFKIDVGVEIDYTGNMETSIRVSDVDGNVLYSYSGAVFDVTAYQDYSYPAVYVYKEGYIDNYGIYYPSLAISGAVPVATDMVPVTVTSTVTSTETITSTITETTTVMYIATVVEPATVTSTETVVVPVERWSTVTETVTVAGKVDYMATAIVAVMALLLVVALYVLLRRKR